MSTAQGAEVEINTSVEKGEAPLLTVVSTETEEEIWEKDEALKAQEIIEGLPSVIEEFNNRHLTIRIKELKVLELDSCYDGKIKRGHSINTLAGAAKIIHDWAIKHRYHPLVVLDNRNFKNEHHDLYITW